MEYTTEKFDATLSQLGLTANFNLKTYQTNFWIKDVIMNANNLFIRTNLISFDNYKNENEVFSAVSKTTINTKIKVHG